MTPTRPNFLVFILLAGMLAAGCSGGETSGAHATSLDEAAFEKEVAHADGPVLVDFWSPSCPPCLRLAPVIEELAEEYAGRVKVCKVNVSEHPALARAHRIRGIPCMILFRKGEEVDRKVGINPSDIKGSVKAWLDSHL